MLKVCHRFRECYIAYSTTKVDIICVMYIHTYTYLLTHYSHLSHSSPPFLFSTSSILSVSFPSPLLSPLIFPSAFCFLFTIFVYNSIIYYVCSCTFTPHISSPSFFHFSSLRILLSPSTRSLPLSSHILLPHIPSHLPALCSSFFFPLSVEKSTLILRPRTLLGHYTTQSCWRLILLLLHLLLLLLLNSYYIPNQGRAQSVGELGTLGKPGHNRIPMIKEENLKAGGTQVKWWTSLYNICNCKGLLWREF